MDTAIRQLQVDLFERAAALQALAARQHQEVVVGMCYADVEPRMGVSDQQQSASYSAAARQVYEAACERATK